MAKRFILHMLLAATFCIVAALMRNLGLIESDYLIAWAAVLILFGALLVSSGQLFSPSMMFTLPWVFILFSASLDVSLYSRPVSAETHFLLLSTTLLGCLAGSMFYQRLPIGLAQQINVEFPSHGKWEVIYILFVLSFAALNVAFSGYVPLISAATTGASGYLEFGVPSLLGLFYAVINSASLVFFIKYQKTKNMIAAVCVGLAFVVQIMFYSRQNVIFLFIELYILSCFLSRFPHPLRIIIVFAGLLTVFAYAGDLRSGSIRDLVQLNDEYSEMPTAAIWLYGYSYFNVLNLDNTVSSVRPDFTGSSLNQLLPSFLRKDDLYGDGSLLELSNFNVSSYLSGIYVDVGFWGCCVFIFVVMSVISFLYYMRLFRAGIINASVACVVTVLLVAALFSFFHNFFFFPPVIFQTIIAPVILKIISTPILTFSGDSKYRS